MDPPRRISQSHKSKCTRTHITQFVHLRHLYSLFIFLFQGLELKGQMVFCPESDSVLFIGSPFIDGLEGLTGSGLFISDIPLHDATRDVILVGEQARAQVRCTWGA